MVVMMILEKEEGAVMQNRGVPSLSPFRSHDSYTFAYNSALQNDLFGKKKKSQPSGVVKQKTSTLSNLQWKKNVHPVKQQAATNLLRWAATVFVPFIFLKLILRHNQPKLLILLLEDTEN